MDSFFEIRSCFHSLFDLKIQFLGFVTVYLCRRNFHFSKFAGHLFRWAKFSWTAWIAIRKIFLTHSQGQTEVPRLLCIVKRFRPPGILHAGAGRGSLYDVTIGK